MTQGDPLNTVSLNEGNGKAKRVVVISVVALVLVAIVGVMLVIRFINQERERDLQAWQIRLGIVADSRVADVSRWLEEQFSTVRSLAQNTSLQLYVGDMLDQSGAPSDTPEVEGSYLRTLLEATAARSGFVNPTSGPTISANVTPANQAGLAVLDAKGKLLISTSDMPPLPPSVKDAMAVAASGQPTLIDLYLNSQGNPTLGFVAPLYGIQNNPQSDPNIGFIVGIRLADKTLFSRLEQPGETPPKGETYMVRRSGNLIDFISPLANGAGPLMHGSMALDTPNLDAAFVIENPGGFAEKVDYQQRRVLVTGRQVVGAPSWYLVRKIDRNAALQETDSRSTTMTTVFLLVIGGMLALILLVWKHGTSVRSAQAASRYRQIASQLENYTDFMRLVTDGQPTSIAAVDAHGRYTFANKGAAEGTGITHEEMIGKTMASVIGPIKAKVLQDMNTIVLSKNQPVSEIHDFAEDPVDENDEEAPPLIKTVKSDHIPLPGNQAHEAGVLMILQDITEVVRERERRENTMRDLVGVLVSLVDRRDPYSSNQSARVVKVARAIATEMGEPDEVVRTVDIAGNLMNLGKTWVPAEILAKTTKLTDDEMKIVRDSMIASADLLEEVHFDLPIAATLRQLQERWDGKGFPDGLQGENILVSARIVAVANAFVSMVSPRSYREGMDFNQACSNLMAEMNHRFDPRPIAALINYLNNRGGAQEWASFSTKIDG